MKSYSARKVTLIPFLTLLGLIGCSTYSDGRLGSYAPTPQNGYRGLIGWEVIDSDHSARREMQARCSQFGGLKVSSIQKAPTPRGGVLMMNYATYECNGPQLSKQAQPYPDPTNLKKLESAENNSPPPKTQKSLDAARAKCSDLGLKSGTEKYGECVLRLSK